MKKFFGFGLKKKEQPSAALSVSPLLLGADDGGYDLQVEDLGKLHRAVAFGDLKKLRKRAKKHDLNQQDEDNRTPLHLACASGCADVVTFLVDKKCQLNLCDNENRSPLMKAVQCQQEGCAVYLLQHGADPNVADLENNTALHFAACNSSLSVAEQLLIAKANINAQNKDGSTPLMLAVDKSKQEMAEFLLNEGASVNARENTRRTPLMAAASKGDNALISLLLQYGADASKRDKKGWTAGHHALMAGYSVIAKKLLRLSFQKNAETSSSESSSVPVMPIFNISSDEEDWCKLGAPASNKEVVDDASGDSTRKTDDENHLLSDGDIDFSSKIQKPENHDLLVSVKRRFMENLNKMNLFGVKQEEDLQDGSFKKGKAKEEEDTDADSPWDSESISESPRKTTVDSLPTAKDTVHIHGVSGESCDGRLNDSQKPEGTDFREKEISELLEELGLGRLNDSQKPEGTDFREKEISELLEELGLDKLDSDSPNISLKSTPCAKPLNGVVLEDHAKSDTASKKLETIPVGVTLSDAQTIIPLKGGQCNEQKGIKEMATDENKEKRNQKWEELEAAGKSGNAAVEKELAMNIFEQKSEPKPPVKKNQYMKSGKMLEESQVKNKISSVKRKELVSTSVRRKSARTVKRKNKEKLNQKWEKLKAAGKRGKAAIEEEWALIREKPKMCIYVLDAESVKMLEESKVKNVISSEKLNELVSPTVKSPDVSMKRMRKTEGHEQNKRWISKQRASQQINKQTPQAEDDSSWSEPSVEEASPDVSMKRMRKTEGHEKNKRWISKQRASQQINKQTPQAEDDSSWSEPSVEEASPDVSMKRMRKTEGHEKNKRWISKQRASQQINKQTPQAEDDSSWSEPSVEEARISARTVNRNNKMAYKRDQEKELLHKNLILQDELAVLRFKFDQIKVQCQEEAAKYLEENEALKLENAELKNELKLNEEALTQTILQYSGQVNIAKTECAMIISKLELIKEDKERLEKELDTFHSRLSSTTQGLEQINRSKIDLERTLQCERDEWLRSKEKLQETNNAMSQLLSKTENKINGLENDLQHVTFALLEKDLLIESIQKELSQAHCPVKEFENLLQMEKDQMNQYIIQLESTQEQLSQLQSENLFLRQQLEAFKNQGIIKERVISDIQDRFSEIFTQLRADADKQVQMVEERNKELIAKCNKLRDQVFKYETEKVERELDDEKKKVKKLEELIYSVETELDQERMRNSELQKENLGISKLLRRTEDKLKEYESEETVPQSIHQRERKKMFTEIDMEAGRLTAEPCYNCLEERKVRKILEQKLDQANEELLEANAKLLHEQQRKTSPLASSFASGSLSGSPALDIARLENSRASQNRLAADLMKKRMELEENINKELDEGMLPNWILEILKLPAVKVLIEAPSVQI